MQSFINFLLAKYPKGFLETQDVVDSAIEFKHKNIQFSELISKNKEARENISKTLGNIINEGHWQEIIRAGVLNVVAEEYKFISGKYPDKIFIESRAHIAKWIDEVFAAEDNQKLLLSDCSFFCVGSCFASNISLALKKRGASVSTTVISENVNSPRNNADLFDYLKTGQKKGLLLSEKFSVNSELDHVRENFKTSNVLILTLGCSFSLIDSITGLPVDKVSKKSVFDNPSVEEIKNNIIGILDVAKSYGYRRVFVTVSPVPLAGTLLYNGNPFISDTVSKSKLRSAIDEVCFVEPSVTYFPSFEVFRQLSLHSFFPTLGLDDNYSRHVNEDIVNFIINKFLMQNFLCA